MDDYRGLLRRFYTLYQPLEQRLAAAVDWPALHWPFAARLKTPLLRHDLTALGDRPEDLARWAQCATLPVLETLGESVGALYVIEGSTLGGQILSRQFRETLQVTPEHGGDFFHGYGATTGMHWREFGQWAEANASSAGPGFAESAVEGARQTFEAFTRWLR